MEQMWKSGDVRTLIRDALLEVDGTLSDDDSGEAYFVEVEMNHKDSEIIATIETEKPGSQKIVDKYRIKVERL